jgi:hypothetical protein
MRTWLRRPTLFSSKSFFFFLAIPSKACEFLPNALKASVLIKKVLDVLNFLGHSLKKAATDGRLYAIDTANIGF